jgi:two-component system cell cycle sensor histidine kinase/response regulator CckA
VDKFVKLLLLVFSLLPAVIFFILGQKTQDKFYTTGGVILLFVYFSIILLLYLPTYIKLKRQLKQASTEVKPKKANIGTIPDYTNFLANCPIPSVITDASLNLEHKNNAYIDLEEKYKVGHIKTLFDIISDDKIQLAKKIISISNTGYKNNTLKVNLQNDQKVTLNLYIVPFGDRPTQNKFIIFILDNSEEIDLKEKFIQAQKMQAVGQLAGGISHDFNNLLTAIIGFCDLLLTRHPPGEQSFADIMQIKHNANRAANLVRQLLAFSRKQTLQMEVLNIMDVLADLSNLMRRLLGENIELKVNHGRDIWDIKADRSQLEQVIINLAVNARDAMDKKGTLFIETHNADIFSGNDIKFKFLNNNFKGEVEPGSYAVIHFSDNGCGIPREKLEQIFEPFYTTKSVGEGTGLGLATVTGIIEQTGGQIFVSSEEGKGTEFIILLKKTEATSQKTEPEKASQKQADLTGVGTILIVEDEEPVRMFTARALKNKGYNVLEAYNGERALEIMAEYGDKVDMIVSDVVMPGISGPEMADEIKKTYPDLKIIFVSGYGEDAFRENYGDVRDFHFLPKPYTLNQLAAKVKELM